MAWTVTRSVLVPPTGSRAASSRSPVTCGSPAGNGPCPDIRKWAPGWCPGGGSMEVLPALAGRSRALEIIVGSEDFDADTAQQ